MRLKTHRVLFRVGQDSYAVTLTKYWITYHALKVGDYVEITVNHEITIRVKSEKKRIREPKS